MRAPSRYSLFFGTLLSQGLLLCEWLGGVALAQETITTEDLKIPSAWVKSFDTHLWAGYKDNVLLGSQNLEASPFIAGGLDVTLYRVPVDGWEYLFLSSAEYIRYLS